MKLIKIDKQRYRKHLNRVIAAAIAALVIGSLSIAQGLIALFPDPSGSHFHWNLLGVILTGLGIALVLNRYKQHSYMNEVTYVWELKKSLNKITRKLRKLQAAAQEGKVDAMIALQYSYAGSRLLWELDDNMIIMDELAVAQAELDRLAEQYCLTLNADDYDESMLKQF